MKIINHDFHVKRGFISNTGARYWDDLSESQVIRLGVVNVCLQEHQGGYVEVDRSDDDHENEHGNMFGEGLAFHAEFSLSVLSEYRSPFS